MLGNRVADAALVDSCAQEGENGLLTGGGRSYLINLNGGYLIDLTDKGYLIDLTEWDGGSKGYLIDLTDWDGGSKGTLLGCSSHC